MSINKYAYKVQETSTSTGSSGLTLEGASTSYRTFLDAVGDDTYFTYYVSNDDNTLEWEYGIGYINDDSVAAGVLIRSQILSSSNGGSAVAFTSGTKTVSLVQTQKDIISYKNISADETLEFVSATYIVDASAANVELTLPSIDAGFNTTGNSQTVSIAVVLNATTGSQTEQADAITLTPDGADTIAGDTSYTLSILNDFIQIVADPDNDNWVVLDPIQDSVYPSGGDGAIQFAENQGFSYASGLYWNIANDSLHIGASGSADASILLPSSGNVVFNNQNYSTDIQIKSANEDNVFYVDASADNIGIGTNSPASKLDVMISGTDGIGVRTEDSASMPYVLLDNSYTGLAAGDDIGAIVFRALDSADSSTDYGKILVEFISDTDSQEEGLMKLQINKDGLLQTVAEFAYSGIVIGVDNTNIDGIVIGEQHSNDGDNILIGYSHSVSGTNFISIGQNNTSSEGLVGCAFGIDHDVSGANIWVIGGSGMTAHTDNTINICYDASNYLEISSSGSVSFYGLNNTDGMTTNFINTNPLSSASSDSLGLVFYNSVGSAVTGVSVVNTISDPTDGSETTSLQINGMDNGSIKTLVDVSSSGLVLGYGDTTTDNIVIGVSNTGDGSDNIIMGQNISVTGDSNTVVGISNIVVSGTGNVSVFGSNNSVDSSGNHHILVAGISNTVDEDYSITLGVNNSNSGLYGTVVGFDNGATGSYSSILGENNLVTNDSSVAVGNNNSVNSTDINAQGFAFGAGNSTTASGTGVLVGFDNSMIGMGGAIIGIDIDSSGNNIVFGRDVTVSGTNNIVIASGITLTDNDVVYIANTGASIVLDGSTCAITGALELNGSGVVDIVTDAMVAALTGDGGVTISLDGDTVVVSGTDVYDASITVTGTGNLTGGGSFTLNQTGTDTIEIGFDTTADLDMQGNKVLFGNMYDTTGLLPNASTYHGMFAHVHAEAAAYFAHNGQWVELANASHTHTSTDITDFESAVTGLVGVTYSPTGHTHTSVDVTDFETAVTGITELLYSPTGHTHTSVDVTDFETAVTGITELLYSPTGHTHTSVDVTDFEAAVTGITDLLYEPLGGGGGGGSLSGSLEGNIDLATYSITGVGSVDIAGDFTGDDLYISGINSTNGDNNIIISGHFIPISNENYDLGNAEYKWRHLYLSSNTIYFGDAEDSVSVSGSDMTINGQTASYQNQVIAISGGTWSAGNTITMSVVPTAKIKEPRLGIPDIVTIIVSSGIEDCVLNSTSLGFSSYPLGDTSANNSLTYYSIKLESGAVMTPTSDPIDIQLEYTGIATAPIGIAVTGIIQGTIL